MKKGRGNDLGEDEIQCNGDSTQEDLSTLDTRTPLSTNSIFALLKGKLQSEEREGSLRTDVDSRKHPRELMMMRRRSRRLGKEEDDYTVHWLHTEGRHLRGWKRRMTPQVSLLLVVRLSFVYSLPFFLSILFDHHRMTLTSCRILRDKNHYLLCTFLQLKRDSPLSHLFKWTWMFFLSSWKSKVTEGDDWRCVEKLESFQMPCSQSPLHSLSYLPQLCIFCHCCRKKRTQEHKRREMKEQRERETRDRTMTLCVWCSTWWEQEKSVFIWKTNLEFLFSRTMREMCSLSTWTFLSPSPSPDSPSRSLLSNEFYFIKVDGPWKSHPCTTDWFG